jgi:hypothetical protein
MHVLDGEQRDFLRGLFPVPEEACHDCGGYHLRRCPRVKREVFLGQGAGMGSRIEVEYFAHWDDSEVIWPEDVFDDAGGNDG